MLYKRGLPALFTAALMLYTVEKEKDRKKRPNQRQEEREVSLTSILMSLKWVGDGG